MANLTEAAKRQISTLVLDSYRRAAQRGELPEGSDIVPAADTPKDPSLGDYASSFALAAAKSMRMPPRKIAEAIAANIDLEDSFFSSVEIAGAGFLNFRLSDKWYRAVLSAIETEGDGYGRVDAGHGEKVMVEFVSANPTGSMTIGNARGGVLGDTMASVLDRAGYKVHREFYVNDAGNQVELFAASVEARYLQEILGEDKAEFPEDGYHGDDIKALAHVFREKFGDGYVGKSSAERREAMKTFGLEYNIDKMRRDLERYGIKYDCWFRESSLHESGYVAETVKLLEDAGYTYEKDGALWFRVTELGGEKDEVLRRSNGFYTYFAVDLAYHRNKFLVRGFDRVIDVLGADHHGHALRFKASIGALGIDKNRLDFLIMQLVRLMRDGETVKVSKRTGKAIALSDLLDEISCDAARFFFNAKPDTHLDFDLGLAVRQDSENPVYYVQYAHARICSLIKALGEEGFGVESADTIKISALTEPCERDLIKQLSMLPEEIRLAARDYDPSRINRYVVDIAARFHRFYNACRIKGEETELLQARLKLADCTRSVLAVCLGILGVTAPEKM